jgi:hypothetical protein
LSLPGATAKHAAEILVRSAKQNERERLANEALAELRLGTLEGAAVLVP